MKIDSTLVNDWLKKSENDLLAANGIMYYYEEPPTDTICYHCHQTVEKGLKAFLLYKEVDVPRTHDLIELLNLAGFEDKNFLDFKNEIEALNKYYIEAKYPIANPIVYSKKEAKTALDYANNFFSFIKEKV